MQKTGGGDLPSGDSQIVLLPYSIWDDGIGDIMQEKGLSVCNAHITFDVQIRAV